MFHAVVLYIFQNCWQQLVRQKYLKFNPFVLNLVKESVKKRWWTEAFYPLSAYTFWFRQLRDFKRFFLDFNCLVKIFVPWPYFNKKISKTWSKVSHQSLISFFLSLTNYNLLESRCLSFLITEFMSSSTWLYTVVNKIIKYSFKISLFNYLLEFLQCVCQFSTKFVIYKGHIRVVSKIYEQPS